MPTPTITDAEQVMLNTIAQHLVAEGATPDVVRAWAVAVASGEQVYPDFATSLFVPAMRLFMQSTNEERTRMLDYAGYGARTLADTAEAMGYRRGIRCTRCNSRMTQSMVCGDCTGFLARERVERERRGEYTPF